jgi:hypothetical protein
MSEDLRLAWAVVNPDNTPTISKRQLLNAVHFVGRNPSRKEMQVSFALVCLKIQRQGDIHAAQKFTAPYGPNGSFTFEDLTKLCSTVREPLVV